MLHNNSIEVFWGLLKAGLWEDNGEGLMVPGLNNNNNNVNWEEVCNLASEQSVVGLLAAGIDWFAIHDSRFMVPLDVKLNIIGEAVQIELQNANMNKFIAELVRKMRDAGIYTLLVKGQGVAQCYEKPLWRSCGDVDLFLSDGNYNKAKDFLTPLASEVEGEYVGIKHQGMTIDGWVVELHGSLNVGLPGKINRVLDDIYIDTFNGGNVRSWDNNGVQVFMLGVENDIFYVFVHFVNHFYKGGIGLRQICDWCRLLYTYREKQDLQKLESRIRKAGLMSEWKAFGAFVVEYLGMPVEAMPFYNYNDNQNEKFKKKAERIKNFILMSGNFGHNRDMSFYSKYTFVVRKFYSMKMRVGDLINHARIFPLDSLKFFPIIMWNGMKSAVRGEG